MTEETTNVEIQADRAGKVGAVLGLILFVLLLFVPLFFTTLPKPGQPGILVNLGVIDMGQGNENAGPSAAAAPPPRAVEPSPQAPREEVAPPPPPPPPAVVEKPRPEPVERGVVATETPQQIAIRKQKAREEAKREAEAAKRRRDKAAADRRSKAESDRLRAVELERRRRAAVEAEAERARAAEAQRQRDAAAEAQRQREAEAAANRNKVGGLFGGGSGRGETGTAGNQGVENGDPNADRLKGVSTGDGRVSGGLGGRGVESSPVVRENSQRPGRVVVDVCVGPAGNILSAEYTQAGSTTTDPNLLSAAQRNARQWKFKADPNAPERQCGKITYDFKVQ